MKYYKTTSEIDMSAAENIIYIKSGIKILDEQIKGFALGELSVWSGGNGSGKSTLLNQIAIESILQGYNTLIFSGELQDKRLIKWLNIQLCGKKHLQYNKDKNEYTPFDLETTTNITNNKLFIYDNMVGNDVSKIIEAIKCAVKEKNIKTVILDNLMSMNLSAYGSDKYDEQTKFVTELSNLVKQLDIHVHFVCHPRKATTFLRKYDISGTADLTNLADNVFIVHRTNNDFKIQTKQMFGWKKEDSIYNYSSVVEICKNREFGVQDTFIGQYFEEETKRFKNTKNEEKNYYERGLDIIRIENLII